MPNKFISSVKDYVGQAKLTTSKVVVVMLAIISSWWIMVTTHFADLEPILGKYVDFFDSKRLIEVAFIVIICMLYSKSLKISIKKMFTRIDAKILAATLIASAAFLFICNVIFNMKICKLDFGSLTSLIKLLYLALFEEMAFRGWGYNAFYSTYKDNSKIRLFKKFEIEKSALKAAIMTNIFFALIHMQAYMMFYNYKSIGLYIYSLFGVFITGIYFTIIFSKTKSIWNAVILHAFWDWFIGCMVF